jgi:hypothetical protein
MLIKIFIIQDTCKCKYDCRGFNVEVRTLHTEFWKEKPDNQGNFLYALINTTVVKQRRSHKEDDVLSRKIQLSDAYYLP